nr:polyprenyl synthetase family protein [Anaerolineae bacterium]
MMASIEQAFTRLLPLIEADLHFVLEPRDTYPPDFYHMLHYHMGWVDKYGAASDKNQGKRLRPVLALLVCEAVSGGIDVARPAAAAVELTHNFSLLHDDIQDSSSRRRNRATVWKIWGKAQAINAGDVLFTLSHLAIPSLAAYLQVDLDAAAQLELLGEVCLELTRGQHLDMAFEHRDDVTTGDYLDMIAGKTAALLGGAAYLGALSASASPEVLGHFRAFGSYLGIAFQVLDDILDIWGDPDLTGKQAAIDIRQRKKSLPVLHGLSISDELREIYRLPGAFDSPTVDRVVALLDSVGARHYAEELARNYTDRTLASLEAADPSGEAGEVLRELVGQLLNRRR